MTPPDVSDAAVEAALNAVPFADEGDSAMVWQQLGYSNERAEKIVRAAIAAAVQEMGVAVLIAADEQYDDLRDRLFLLMMADPRRDSLLIEIRDADKRRRAALANVTRLRTQENADG